MKPRAVIIGGGLAGLAAALHLAEHDWQPVILETRRKLGGRATSFVDPRTDEVLDNCQHVLLGCCTNLIDFYDRIGVLDLVEWHRTLYWTAGRGEIDELRSGALPAPLHLAPALRSMRIFSRQEKREIARAMRRILRLGLAGRLAWRSRSFADFLREHGQSDRTIRRFWNTVIVSACNMDAGRVSAEPALQVFQEGFLAHRWAYEMGVPAVPLWNLYDPAVERLCERGGEVRLGVSAQSIAYDGRRVSGVVTSEGLVEGAAVVSAVPPDRLDRLVSPTLRCVDTRLQRLAEMGTSPILGVHLRFRDPVMELPHLVLVDHAVQWIFNKGVDETGSQHLHAVVSAADEWMDLDEEEIVERVLRDVHHVLPQAAGLRPCSARAVKEKRATFAATPGVDGLRPAAAPGAVGLHGGGVENLFLAGDWTDTGWPATMEGAVRSGYAAAGAILDRRLLVDDLPTAWLSRLLGLR